MRSSVFCKEAFRVRESRPERAVERKRRGVNRKRRIAYRLRVKNWDEQARAMFAAGNIHYDLAERDRGLGEGGLGRCTCWPGGWG